MTRRGWKRILRPGVAQFLGWDAAKNLSEDQWDTIIEYAEKDQFDRLKSYLRGLSESASFYGP